MSARRVIALGIIGIALVLNGHEAATATVVFKSKSVLVRQTGNVCIGRPTDEPKRLRPIEKYIPGCGKSECETPLADEFGSFSTGSQNPLGKNVHDLSVIRDAGQFSGYYYVFLYVSQECRGFTVVFDPISGDYTQRSELASGGVSLMEFIDLAGADSFAAHGVVMVDDEQNRPLGLGENISAVASSAGSLFAGRDRPLHMAGMNFGNQPEPPGRPPERASETDQRQRFEDKPKIVVALDRGYDRPEDDPDFDSKTIAGGLFVAGVIGLVVFFVIAEWRIRQPKRRDGRSDRS